MIYTEQTVRAMQIAYDAHHGQTDKGGVPYIFHPIHLAEQMQDEETTTAALLHDVVEDTPYTLKKLASAGISATVLEAVKLLTHEEGVAYMEYVERLSHNRIARAVKCADLRHNSDRTRLTDCGENTEKRLKKYKKALKLLEKCAEEETSHTGHRKV